MLPGGPEVLAKSKLRVIDGRFGDARGWNDG